MPTDRWRIFSNGRTSRRSRRAHQPRCRHQAGSDPRAARWRRDRHHRSHPAADRRRAALQRPETCRVPGHRRAQLHEPGRACRTRHRGSSDQGLWRHRGGRMRDRADVGGGARHRPDGPRNARRQLAARGRHAAHRQDARPDRLWRHRRGSRPHRARQRHAGDRLEPDAEAIFRRRIRRAGSAARRQPRRLAASACSTTKPAASSRANASRR